MTHAAVPVVRHTIVKEYQDGDLAVRIIVAARDVQDFWAYFPEANTAAFLGCEQGAIEVTRDVLMSEYRDGSLSVRIRVHPKDKETFRRLWPQPQLAAVLAREDPRPGRQLLLVAAVEERPRFGQQARELRTCVRFVLNPKVWAAVGTDEVYLAWLRTQPCAHCKWVPRWELDQFVQAEAAHVRRVGDGAGTAYKPKYSAISLCHTCHAKQHQFGEGAIGGREFVDRARIRQVFDWVWETLKAELGYEHWNLVPPATLHAWAKEHELVEYLPGAYLVDEDGVPL